MQKTELWQNTSFISRSLACPSYPEEPHLLLIADTQVVLVVYHQNQLRVLKREVVSSTSRQRCFNRWGNSELQERTSLYIK